MSITSTMNMKSMSTKKTTIIITITTITTMKEKPKNMAYKPSYTTADQLLT